MVNKILLIIGILALSLVLFGCAQPGGTQGTGIDASAIDAEIDSSDAEVDSSVSDLPDVPNIVPSDLGSASASGSSTFFDEVSLVASINDSEGELNSMSNFSDLDSASAPDLGAQ